MCVRVCAEWENNLCLHLCTDTHLCILRAECFCFFIWKAFHRISNDIFVSSTQHFTSFFMSFSVSISLRHRSPFSRLIQSCQLFRWIAIWWLKNTVEWEVDVWPPQKRTLTATVSVFPFDVRACWRVALKTHSKLIRRCGIQHKFATFIAVAANASLSGVSTISQTLWCSPRLMQFTQLNCVDNKWQWSNQSERNTHLYNVCNRHKI